MLLLGIIHFVCSVQQLSNRCRLVGFVRDAFSHSSNSNKGKHFQQTLPQYHFHILALCSVCHFFLLSLIGFLFDLVCTFSANAIFLRRTDSFIWISVELGWIRFTNSICIFFWKLRFLLFLLMFSLLLSGIFAIAKQSIDLKLGELKTRWMDIYFFRYRTIKKRITRNRIKANGSISSKA